MKKLIFISLLLMAGSLFAQTSLTFYNFRSVGQTNFLNPAINSRQAFTFGILDNYNHVYLPGITAYDIFRADETGNQTLDKILGDDSYHFRDIQLYNEVNPIFIGFRIKRNYISMGFQNTFNHNIGLPKDMLSMVYFGNANVNEIFGKDVQFSDIQLNMSGISTAYLSFARDINEKLTIGVKGKYHIGLYDAEMRKNVTTFKTDSGENNTFKLTASTDYEIRGAGADRIFGDANGETAGLAGGSTTGANFKRQIAPMDYINNPVGSGFSADIGFNYRATNRLSISGSVLDLGVMNWKEARTYSKKATFSYEGPITDDPENLDSLLQTLGDSLQELFKPEQSSNTTYKTTFSPKFYFGLQYNLFNSGSVGFVGYGEMWKGKFYPGASVSYTQRIWRLMDVRVNYNIFREQYQNVGAGLSLHLGPLVVYAVSDNILGWAPFDGTLKLDAHYTNARVGVNINIGGRHDRDNDGVPDKKDKCKKVPGLIKFDGCPDSDNDSVPDTKDECIDVKGSVAANGCPDMDGDGIKDLLDSCINEKGSARLNGCPDKDNDGVADKYDKCPNDSGLVSQDGCPDRDGDGILDKADACPDQAGWVVTKGCPDSDRDSVPDSEDMCPAIPGSVLLKGCPDIDGDGIINSKDSCVAEAGPASTFGCPDTDNDGIADKYDNCPTEAGTPENYGCPKLDSSLVILNEEEKKVLNEAFSSLEFQTGTSKIAESSLPSLTELSELLVAKPTYNLEINGYTDNVGNAAKNKKLSQDRANAVKSFLSDKGVQGSRLKATGHGSKNPIADNKTPEGRQKNRRVEFKIVK
jgi:outer membrane protein OmpA-like peptidoglycan-associated protein